MSLIGLLDGIVGDLVEKNILAVGLDRLSGVGVKDLGGVGVVPVGLVGTLVVTKNDGTEVKGSNGGSVVSATAKAEVSNDDVTDDVVVSVVGDGVVVIVVTGGGGKDEGLGTEAMVVDDDADDEITVKNEHAQT